MSCKNKGCNGLARRGQYFCYDCYTAWQQGGDDAVAKRIEELQKGDLELAELKAFKERVFDAVLPAFPGAPPCAVRRTEKVLFEVISAGHYTISKLRKKWYDSPDFSGLHVPKSGPNVRFRRAHLMVEWYTAQLDKANKPKPIVLETVRIKPRAETLRPYDEVLSYDMQRGCPKAKCGAQCWAMLGFPCVPVKVCNHPAPTVKHPSAKTTDEAGPLRLRVAELEGKLLCAQQGIIPSVFIKGLCIVSMLAGLGFGFLLK